MKVNKLEQLQIEVLRWTTRNFPKAEPWEPLVRLVEEVGKLAHAHLNQHQGFRGSHKLHQLKKEDAVGDILIYLAHYCSLCTINMSDAVNKAWGEVKQRDWSNETAQRLADGVS